MPAVIVTRNLSVRYHDRPAFTGVSAKIAARKITALIGASGSGKSSFLRTLNRLIDSIPEAHVDGSILFQGEEVNNPDTDVITLRRRVGMVFQNPTPFPLSVYDNVAYGLEIQGWRRAARGWSAGRRTAEEVALSLNPLDQTVVQSLREAALWDEVKDRLDQSALRLSGGQQQRLCIARAIAVRPEVLLLDEPCSQLDPISTKKIEDLLLKLKKRYTIVIVTHNLQQARRISDYVGFFHLGKLEEIGPTGRVFDHPRRATTGRYVRGEFG